MFQIRTTFAVVPAAGSLILAGATHAQTPAQTSPQAQPKAQTAAPATATPEPMAATERPAQSRLRDRPQPEWAGGSARA
jgi:hypothetical protein